MKFYCNGVAVSLLVSGLTVDLRAFCGVIMVQCVMLIMLRIFELGVLVFDCFVHRQNRNVYKVWALRR